jgi:hypothetical protein
MRVALALAIGASLIGTSASAKIYEISVDGALTEQLAPGTDPNLSVGSKLKLSMRFDDRYTINLPEFGYRVAGAYGYVDLGNGNHKNIILPTTGEQYFRIDAPGLTWRTTDDEQDGTAFYVFDESEIGGDAFAFGRPMVLFNDTKVLGLAGYLYPGDGIGRPTLSLFGSPGFGQHSVYDDGYGNLVTEHNFTPATFDPTFKIDNSGTNPLNQYITPGFRGVWDFANSKVQAVPEPSSWAMLIAGFGLAGAAMRRRQETRSANRLV